VKPRMKERCTWSRCRRVFGSCDPKGHLKAWDSYENQFRSLDSFIEFHQIMQSRPQPRQRSSARSFMRSPRAFCAKSALSPSSATGMSMDQRSPGRPVSRVTGPAKSHEASSWLDVRASNCSQCSESDEAAMKVAHSPAVVELDAITPVHKEGSLGLLPDSSRIHRYRV
jgi:hypothetical protein